MSDRVRESLKEILDEDLDLSLDGVTEESSLIDDLGMDSVAFAIGVVAIEEKLGVKLAEREIYDAKTVGDLEEAIRLKMSVTQ
ncbi:acyl carrier protein [Gordonia sp. HY002]|uniref:acyl carrier protein n=1 Tax=Gordonia zhenghanii TaxID=2911516 RepID=UPI001EEFA782|nr:acyl carrier protein [Gordonia zhenghanii]MCF8568837.1 acyl carrier protein [Gordonia zhenghanii]MCF8602293.1 acyl carrier protein [Gordonia zhenghanii]